jgi:hypothetical protein
MNLAACRPQLAGRVRQSRRDPVGVSGEKYRLSAEFSAGTTASMSEAA